METKHQETNFYQKGKIYGLYSKIDGSLFYIGSTCNSLQKRWSNHRKHAKSLVHNSSKLYQYVNDLGVDNFYIELIKYAKCDNKDDLAKTEGETIRQYVSQGFNLMNIQKWNGTENFCSICHQNVRGDGRRMSEHIESQKHKRFAIIEEKRQDEIKSLKQRIVDLETEIALLK